MILIATASSVNGFFSFSWNLFTRNNNFYLTLFLLRLTIIIYLNVLSGYVWHLYIRNKFHSHLKTKEVLRLLVHFIVSWMGIYRNKNNANMYVGMGTRGENVFLDSIKFTLVPYVIKTYIFIQFNTTFTIICYG